MAGGEGFEPPLTESESVVLPLDDPPTGHGRREFLLAFRVLRCAAGFAESDFLAFYFAGVTCDESGFA